MFKTLSLVQKAMLTIAVPHVCYENKKLSCRREAARLSVSFEILLSHSGHSKLHR